VLARLGTTSVPILPPYYSVRLLPYVVPYISTRRRRVLREHPALEKEDYDLNEL
jgi:hypothetical protein